MAPHRHLFFELLLVTRGSGTVVVGQRELTVRPQTVVALRPGVEHDCRRLADADGWSIIFLAQGVHAAERAALAFDEAIPDDVMFDVFRLSVLEAPQPIALGAEAFAAATHLVTCMHDELGAQRAGYDVMVRSALRMLLVTVARCANDGVSDAPARSSRASHAFVADVFADIDAHYADSSSLLAAARRLDARPGHLTTKLRRLTGRTYGMWVIERRMIEARQLLASTECSLATIAERLGYAEIESFARRFRKHHAMTPARWRMHARTTALRDAAAHPYDELRSMRA